MKDVDLPTDNEGVAMVTVWYLQMFAHNGRTVVPPREGIAVTHRRDISVAEYRALYDLVGADYGWVSKKKLTDEELAVHLANPSIEIHVLTVDGKAAGFAEFVREIPGEIEMVQFGLAREFIGVGLGKYFLQQMIDLAWSYAPQRFWLHTCSNDHHAALPNYQKAGFVLYDERVKD